MTMPFGKYRGRPLNEVPNDYLQWLLDDCEYVAARPSLRDVLEVEWERRINPPPPDPIAPAVRQTICEFVRAGFRALVQRHHPDHGGEHAAMIRINQQADTLRREGWL